MKVKKLSKTTNIRDCSQKLWRWLEMSRDDVSGRRGKIPLIGDLTFEVWQATGDDGIYFGTSWEHATQNAVNARDDRLFQKTET
jgi:hypothetical protein